MASAHPSSSPGPDPIPSLVSSLQLEPHPEGGFFKRWYTSSVSCGDLYSSGRGYPSSAIRASASSIHYLLPARGRCQLHSIRGDELWVWQRGGCLVVVELLRDGGGVLQLRRTVLGPNAQRGEVLVHCVEGGTLFGAYTPGDAEAGYALVVCMVTPGFDFADWLMPRAADIRSRSELGEGVEDAVAWLAHEGERAGEGAPQGWL